MRGGSNSERSFVLRTAKNSHPHCAVDTVTLAVSGVERRHVPKPPNQGFAACQDYSAILRQADQFVATSTKPDLQSSIQETINEIRWVLPPDTLNEGAVKSGPPLVVAAAAEPSARARIHLYAILYSAISIWSVRGGLIDLVLMHPDADYRGKWGTVR